MEFQDFGISMFSLRLKFGKVTNIRPTKETLWERHELTLMVGNVESCSYKVQFLSTLTVDLPIEVSEFCCVFPSMEFQDFGISLFSLRLGFWGPGPVMTLVWYSPATTAAAMCHSLLPTMYQTRERERGHRKHLLTTV